MMRVSHGLFLNLMETFNSFNNLAANIGAFESIQNAANEAMGFAGIGVFNDRAVENHSVEDEIRRIQEKIEELDAKRKDIDRRMSVSPDVSDSEMSDFYDDYIDRLRAEMERLKERKEKLPQEEGSFVEEALYPKDTTSDGFESTTRPSAAKDVKPDRHTQNEDERQ